MRRRQLFEIEDFDWCPQTVRDGGTDWLGFLANATRVFSAIAPRIRAAMQATGTSAVLDLCSGAGGPWPTLLPKLAKSGPVLVTLSDLYPNAEAPNVLRARSGGRLAYVPTAVDATAVPVELDGVRTMFSAFHHFPPESARAILADAVAKRRAIAVFESTNSRSLGALVMLLQLPAILLLTPFVRPFRWSRLFLTYLLPLIPLIVLFDGTVSFLRIYLEDELRELVQQVSEHDTFDWDIGSVRIHGLPAGVTYLVGMPKQEA